MRDPDAYAERLASQIKSDNKKRDTTITKCMTANCRYPAAPALKRGPCMRCYTTAKQLVEDGSMTWDEMVGLGLCLSDTDGNPFMDAVNKKMEGK